MPTVPTSPGATTDVRPISFTPQTGAGDPASFGAGSAAALNGLGKTVEDVGNEAATVAQNWAIQDSIRAAKDADVSVRKQTNDLGWKGDGTPQNPGYFNLRGQAAVNAQPQFEAQMADIRQKSLDGLNSNPRAKNMFQNTIDLHMEGLRESSMRFMGQQRQVADLATSTARAGAASDQMTQWWNDPGKIADGANVIRGEMASQGVIHGWSADTLAENTKLALSKSYSETVRSAVAAGDLGAAKSLFDTLGPQMDGATRTALAEHLKHPLQNAAAAAAVNDVLGVSMGGTIGPGGTSDANLTPEAKRLLDTISGPESAGRYNVRYTPQGGATFDGFDKHPNVREPTKDGRTSDAAGRYQFLSSTYNPIAAKLGLNDFSPGSQDKAAWELARSTYADKTGGSLQDDLAAGGNAGKIADALKGQWPSLPGGTQQGTTSAKFAEGIGGNQFAGPGVPIERAASSGAAALIADQTRIHPDFSAAADKLMAKYPNDPEMQQAVLSQLRSRESAYNLGVKTQQETLTKSLKDTQAMLADGKDAEIPELAIRHVFDPPKADAIVNSLNEARDFGQTYKGVQFMPAADYADTRAALASGQGAKAAMSRLTGKAVLPGSPETADTVPGDGGYAQRQKNLANFDAAWKQRETNLTRDPAAYARNEPSVAAAYKSIDPRNPFTVEQAINASRATQAGLGVAESDIRALGVSEAGNVVKQLHSVSPEKGDMGVELEKMEKQYGKAWPDVSKDLVRAGMAPAYQVLAQMNMPGQEAARSDLSRALQEQATLKEGFGKSIVNTERNAMDMQIKSNLEDVRHTLGAFGNNSIAESVIYPAVSTLATHYATQGRSGTDAADAAYKAVMGKYEFGGNDRMLMAPKFYEGKPLGVDAVVAAGRTVTSGLKDADLKNTTAAEARASYWLRSPDGTGAVLMKKQAQGNFLPVRRTGGDLVSMPFNNLPKGTEDPGGGLF